MKKLLTLLIIVCCLKTTAQKTISFKNVNNYTSKIAESGSFSSGLQGFSSADLNNDGILDIVSASSPSAVSHSITISLGKGNGAFKFDTSFLPGVIGSQYLELVKCADFNKDGNADFMAWCQNSTMYLFKGKGTGKVAYDTAFAVSGQVNEFTDALTTDFNNDGNIDLAFVVGDSSYLLVYLGNGNGRFQTPAKYSVPSLPSTIATADFNNDGNVDIATVSQTTSNNTMLFTNNGNGTFTPSVIPAINSSAYAVTAADFNADGNADIATSYSSDSSIVIRYGNGNGTFSSTIDSLKVPDSYSIYSLVAADFNNDGKTDLASPALVFINLGNGHFVKHTFQANGSYVEVNDYNADGNLDIFTSSGNTLLGKGDGYFDAAELLVANYSCLSMAGGDFNSDGKPDIACTNSQSISIFLDSVGGHFSHPKTIYNANNLAISTIQSADFNNDGKLDLISANYNSSNFSIYFGNGSGSFSAPVSHSSLPANATYLAIADYNGDGKQDIATTGSTNDVLCVFLNNGSGNFSAPSFSTTVSNIIPIYAADYNNDGKTDILCDNSSYFKVLINNGNGTSFTPLTTTISVGGYDKFKMMDINKDGYLDLLNLLSSYAIEIYYGHGAGVYDTSPYIFHVSPNNNPRIFEMGDFNNDGKLDAVALGEDGMSILKGYGVDYYGHCNFAAATWLEYAVGQMGPLVADYDGDGLLDIATVNYNYSTFMEPIIYSNTSACITTTNNACTGTSPIVLKGNPGTGYYVWSPGGSTADSLVVTTPGTYSLLTISINGLDSTQTSTLVNFNNCVWPGDANEDLVVDNNDLLPIGIKFNHNGYPRSSISNAWQGFMSTTWINDTLSNGTNSKYIDCNGDGQITFCDTTAITLNYNLTHPARYTAPPIIQTTNPDIYVQLSKPSYAPGDTVNAYILIGSNTNPQNNFYGAAFTLQFDDSKAVSGTEKFWFNNSWVGNINQSKIKFSKLDASAGTVNASLVRITHTDTTGFGKIATLQFVLKHPLPSSELYFTINNAIKTNHLGLSTNLNAGTDSVLIDATLAINQLSNNNAIKIYPNPANNKITIDATDVTDVKFFDVLGKQIISTKTNDVDVSNLPEGVYFIQVKTNASTSTQKVIVQH